MKINNSNKELRTFCFIFCGYVIFFALLMSKLKNHFILSKHDGIIFIIAMLISLACPIILYPLKKSWDGILSILHWISSRILLGTIFFLLFSPIAIVRKVLKKDILNLMPSHDSSYRTMSSSENDLRRPY